MSDNIKRMRKTGNWQHRIAKYMVVDWPANTDENEAGSSGLIRQQHACESSAGSASDAPSNWQEQDETEINTSNEPDIVLTDYLGSDEEHSGDRHDHCDGEEHSMAFNKMPLIDCVRFWALSTKQTIHSVELVLQMMNRTGMRFPSTYATLMGTNLNASSQIVEIGGGQFWYHGVQNCLLNHFWKSIPPCSTFSLNVSVDGLPLHNSTTLQFWPILINIHELPQVPVMTVAIFYGSTKPGNVEEYLRPMIEEMNFLIEHGIVINGKEIRIKLRAIIADTPARSFVKGIVGHTGYSGCMKCTVEGEYNKAGRTVVFPGTNAPKRTDQEFRNHVYPKHCKVRTPLLDLRDFDMINDVIVADRLHLIDLGVMKRLLIGWRDGSLGTKRWSTPQCQQISAALENIKLPLEIHRPLRPIVHAGRWKGSEFASFLHYASIVVLKEHLSEECYQHFLLFFCGVTILSSSVYRRKWSLAGQLLEKFVAQYSALYGERYVGSNVHNLQHIYEEVARLGPLPSLSTYTFENELQHLKGLLRSGNRNLEQAINRLSELDNFHMSYYKQSMAPNNPLCRENGKYSILRVRRNFILRNDPRNCWFLSKDNNIMQYEKSTMSADSGYIVSGRKLLEKDKIFEEPMDSSDLDIYKGNAHGLLERYDSINIQNIKCKLVAVPLSTTAELVFIPLLHTLEL